DLGIEVKERPTTSLRESRDRAERGALVDALVKTRGNITQASRLLAVSRPTVHGLIDRYDLSPRDFRLAPTGRSWAVRIIPAILITGMSTCGTTPEAPR